MRRLSWLLLLSLFGLSPVGAEQPPATGGRAVFDLSAFRPLVVLHDMPQVTDKGFIAVTGVVFSRAPVEKVTVGERTASTRPAEPKDLLTLQRAPQGVADAPVRTFFEVPDALLARYGANDVEIVALSGDGRTSDRHRVTILRTLAPPAK